MKMPLYVLAVLLPQIACAETGYYLVTTYPNAGQAALDYKYWNAHVPGQPTVASPELGIGYGVNARWYTELSAAWAQVGGSRTHHTGIEWQNDFMLTQGQYDVDVALHTMVERSHDRAEGYAIEFGPVLQTEIGRTQFNVNLFFQRELDNGEHNETELTYQAQVKYRWKNWLQPGVQAFGEVGKWNDWLPRHEQSHRIGPALFGQINLGPNGRQLKYEAAYLSGRNAARSANSFAMRVQYLF
jgi:hypothetical protein